MVEHDLTKTFYPGIKFVKEAYGSSQGWYPEKSIVFLLVQGIVITINTDLNSSSTLIPLYSINAKIVNRDSSDINLENKQLNNWFPPLLPIHDLKLPMKGEVIWILKEASSESSRGYWIGRINDTNKINTVLAKEYLIREKTSQGRYGFDFQVEDFAQKEPEIIYSIPAKEGDIIQQGRKNSFIRHSSKNNNGILELGIKENKKYLLNKDSLSIGDTKTKTIHLENSSYKEIVKLTKKTEAIDEKKNIILHIAQEIYNISNDSNSNNEIYKNVLGEKLNEFLTEVFSLIDNISMNFKTFLKIFNLHKHGIEKLELKNVNTIQTFKGPQTIEVKFKIPARKTTNMSEVFSQQEVLENASLQNKVDKLSERIKNLEDILENKLNDHLSNNNFVN